MTTRLDPGLIVAAARAAFEWNCEHRTGNVSRTWDQLDPDTRAFYLRQAVVVITAIDEHRFGVLLDRVNAEPGHTTRWERLAAWWRSFKTHHLWADDPWDAETQADKKEQYR